jgi:alkanesulfonate monooxygenase SsuD/methylene tetrahydromethanopterin reductase-like flavin-dependent oxidoreductase (luciferase family)
LIGGNGHKRTLPLAARYASEWNAVFSTADELKRHNAHLDELLAQQGRDPKTVRRSLMTGCFFGRDEAALQRKLGQRSAADLRARGNVVGPGAAAVDQLGALAQVSLQRVMLQWLDLDDVDGLEALANAVLPHAPQL